tara:strand:+ start:483 stop:1520 length:1038 start_codon:yes stop_codon:yes gene_type:complete
MKIISIVGARPQFIKLAPLSKELRKDLDEIIIHTGQHFDREMSKLFFQQLNIPKPDYNLGISGGTNAYQVGKMLMDLDKKIRKISPDVIVIFGDTNSTLASALAGSKLNIPLIHIEAGLRSFNQSMPEEINRIITDHCSDYLFAPTKAAITNLKNENLKHRSYLTGDIMVDSIKASLDMIELNHNNNDNYNLLTLHRPYNVDNPSKLNNILRDLNDLNQKIIFPIHPRTKKIIDLHNISIGSNIEFIKPQGYLDFIKLQYNAKKIITDSGGIQKEAYLLGVPCITLRTETEWIETLDSGWNLLVSPDNLKKNKNEIINFLPTKKQTNLFGKNVAKGMVKIIKEII